MAITNKRTSSTIHRYQLLMLCLLISLCQFINAKPTVIEYSRELETLTRALQAIHPTPWRKQTQQKFRDGLTNNPSLLNNYPLGPWLSISQSLKILDPGLQDVVTGINIFAQNKQWQMLPVTLGRFEEGVYIVAAEPEYQQYIGQRLRAINGVNPVKLLEKVSGYFPEHQADWFPQYLRITDLLAFLGAPCKASCEIDLNDAKLQIKPAQKEPGNDRQIELSTVELVRYFWRQYPVEEAVQMISKDSMYWNLSGRAMQASMAFNTAQSHAEGLLRSQLMTNVILDFRAIDAVTPSLVNRVWDEIRRMPDTNSHRTIYVMIDRSTGRLVTDLLARMQHMPEVVFVGESLGFNLSHYYDPKPLKLKKTGLEITIATRYQNYMNNQNSGAFIPDHQVLWRASDFFLGSDSVLNTILDLIEINQP